MEKVNKGHTITIKIDGKQRSYQEKNTNRDQTSHSPVPGSIATEETSEVIQQTEQEVAVTEAKEEEPFDWILPQEEESPEEIKEYKIAAKQKKIKKAKVPKPASSSTLTKRGFVPSVLFAIFFAVVFGTSIGVILLKMVTNDGSLTANGNQAATATQTEEVAATSTITLPAISTFVVQEGAYKTAEGANDAKAAIETKGTVPSAIINTDQSYIFIGVATSKEEAKVLAEQLKQKQVQVYAKEVQLGGSTLANLTETEKSFLELVTKLYAPLVTASTNLSLGKAVPADVQTNLETLEKELTSIKDRSLKNKQVLELKKQVDDALAVASAKDAKQSKEMQQSLLTWLSIYGSLN